MDIGSAVLVLAEANGLTMSDVRATLRAALCDAMEATAPQTGEGSYPACAYVCDVIGDDTSGWLVYEMGGDTYRVPYTITQTGTKRTAALEMSKTQEVMPRTVYDIAGETVLESKRRAKPAESAPIGTAGAVHVSMQAVFCDMTEAAAVAGQPMERLIKIIGPGQGSSCFYPADILERDGPKVFTKGLHMYYNHPTAAEEASRPEGDLHEMAGALSSNAYYDKAGPLGEGLYAKTTVYSDFAQRVAERAANIGVSIRAFGEAKLVNGKYTLQNFSSAESVDFVTKPGAKGAILTEAARTAKPPLQENSGMEKNEVTALIEAAVAPLTAKVTAVETENATLKAQNSGLREAANKNEARVFIADAIRAESMPAAAKGRVLEAVLALQLPLTEAGALDTAKLGAAITAAVKTEQAYILSVTGNSGISGFGLPTREADEEKFETYAPALKESTASQASSRGISEAAQAIYMKGRAN